MSDISPELTAALSRDLAQTMIRSVAAAGGGIHDVLTVGSEGGAVEIMAHQIAECVAAFRDGEREGVVL